MQKQLRDRSVKRQKMLSIIIITILMPATILIGMVFLNDRKYYLISLLIILYTTIPFITAFEGRKPKVRELVIVSVLSAIAVAGRGAFFMLPQFKPVIAIIIIAGVCSGEESGFLVGILTGFVSNIFFGQGPWTPFQMFSLGIIGFLAGLLYKKGILKNSKVSLCIFGGLTTFFVFGGIMNLASLLISTQRFSWKALTAIYVSGFWFDVIHSTSTIFFLYFISQPMVEKMERIKNKFGFIDG
ncbi:MAG: ECF transporter S component [Clostridiales bacterium]|nr:ECF transporter S component [Clostridiales bacterium]